MNRSRRLLGRDDHYNNISVNNNCHVFESLDNLERTHFHTLVISYCTESSCTRVRFAVYAIVAKLK